MRRTLLAILGTAAAGALAVALALATPTPAAAAPAHTVAAATQHQSDEPYVYHNAGPMARLLVRITADLTGQDGPTVRQAVIGGQSLAAFAAANGSSGEAVVDRLVERARRQLDQAVADGRLTRQRADRALERITARATALVNDATLGQRLAGRR